MPPKRDHFRGQCPLQSPQNVGLFRAKVLLAHVAGPLVSTSVAISTLVSARVIELRPVYYNTPQSFAKRVLMPSHQIEAFLEQPKPTTV